MNISLTNLLPKNANFSTYKDYILIDMKNERGMSPTPVKIKKQIKMSEELGILLGFWAGDGTKTHSTFALTNNNQELVRKLHHTFTKIFGNKQKIYLIIMLPSNFALRKKEILKNTMNAFPKIKNVRITRYLKERNNPILSIAMHSTIFTRIFRKIYDYCMANIEKQISFQEGYIKGMIAAEGHMDIRKKYNTLSRISIAQRDGEIKGDICRILNNINISYTKDKKSINIFSKKNYDLISDRGLAYLHPVKAAQFDLGYSNIKQEQLSAREITTKILSEAIKPQRISKIAKKLKKNRQTIREHILLKNNSLYKNKLINRIGKEKAERGAMYGELWQITGKGKEYLKDTQLNA